MQSVSALARAVLLMQGRIGFGPRVQASPLRPGGMWPPNSFYVWHPSSVPHVPLKGWWGLTKQM